jgi:hypothetical protein
MRPSSLGAPVLTVILVTAGLAVSDQFANDAGTGTDASNDRANPTMLASWGSYWGNLTSHDADWYGVNNTSAASGPFCFELDATGPSNVLATLGYRGVGVDHAVTAPVSPDASHPISLFLAASQAPTAYAGLTTTTDYTGPQLRYQFNLTGTATPPSVAPNGPTPHGLLTNAVPLPGPCAAGALDPLGGLGHTTDVYSFNGSAGQQIVYSLGSTASDTQLRVVDGNDAVVAPAIGPDAVGNATLPATATYYLVASESASTSVVGYVAALLGPGSPCHPYCAVS